LSRFSGRRDAYGSRYGAWDILSLLGQTRRCYRWRQTVERLGASANRRWDSAVLALGVEDRSRRAVHRSASGSGMLWWAWGRQRLVGTSRCWCSSGLPPRDPTTGASSPLLQSGRCHPYGSDSQAWHTVDPEPRASKAEVPNMGAHRRARSVGDAGHGRRDLERLRLCAVPGNPEYPQRRRDHPVTAL